MTGASPGRTKENGKYAPLNIGDDCHSKIFLISLGLIISSIGNVPSVANPTVRE